ncbi:hypothetical protein WCLP8_3840005 [uncultured Gammaproteobacteria bacterium]
MPCFGLGLLEVCLPVMAVVFGYTEDMKRADLVSDFMAELDGSRNLAFHSIAESNPNASRNGDGEGGRHHSGQPFVWIDRKIIYRGPSNDCR